MIDEILRLAKVDARESGSGYEDDEQAQYYNNPDDARNYQVAGPASCPDYYRPCFCDKCRARDNYHFAKHGLL